MRLLASGLLGIVLLCQTVTRAAEPQSERLSTVKRIYEVNIDGTVDLGLAAFVERIARQADSTSLVIYRIKTFGGRIDAAVPIRDAIFSSDALSVAFIDQRAISAGAFIALATDTLIMSEGSSIGAATPVEQSADGSTQPTSEKVVSYMRAEMRATAEAKGRRGDIAEAMVDPDVEIQGVSQKGKLLTLTSQQALDLKVANAVVARYDDIFTFLNIQAAERVEATSDWGERLARLLTDPVVSSLLMTLGFLGLLIEFYTPGFGLAGGAGITLLVLFFFGQYAAHLAGLEEVLLFVAGLILLLLEVLVLPGFGVAGILGLLALGASLVMAMLELQIPWDVAFDLGYAQEALGTATLRLTLTLVVLIIAAVVFAKHFPKTLAGRFFILQRALGTGAGDDGQSAASRVQPGQIGRTLTPLRPAGVIEVDGQRVDVVSQGAFIDRGCEVEIIEVTPSHRVVVRVFERF